MADKASSSRPKRNRCPRQSKIAKMISYEDSVKNLSKRGKETLKIVNRKTNQRALNTIPGTCSAVFDNTWPSCKWLRPGWIVEERMMVPSERLYRYYYDPLGQLYSTRSAVEYIYARTAEKKEKKRVVIIID
ncbi:hypothetical protein V5N11_003757 [Cardamine amara subsp. amara]|uniref:MBD domain-containing protein n=1 Tax=Cardamine amara subsp. amara TaxID=228776 RepID=A0ABD0ZF23_CARAN